MKSILGKVLKAFALLLSNFMDQVPRPFPWAVNAPMIYRFADADIDVPTKRSVAYLESFRREHEKDIDIVLFDGVGHAMADWNGIFTAGYVPQFLDLLGSWFAEQVSGEPVGD